MQLTQEQKSTIDELRAAIKELNDNADAIWGDVLAARKSGDDEFDYKAAYDAIQAADSEAELKKLIAYVPKKGEHKVGKVTKALEKLREGQYLYLNPGKTRGMRARIDALADINAWRESLNLPPLERLPKGANGDGSECTLAKAYTVDFNSFRAWDSVSVGGQSSTLQWRERIPYTQEAYDKLKSATKPLLKADPDKDAGDSSLYESWEGNWVKANPDYDSGVEFIELEQEDGLNPVIIVHKKWDGAVDGQDTVVSMFDDWQFPDLVVDEELPRAAATMVTRGDSTWAVWDYLQEFITRYGVSGVAEFEKSVKEYLVNHCEWYPVTELKVDLDGQRVLKIIPINDWSDVTGVYVVGCPEGKGSGLAWKIRDEEHTPQRHQESHDPDQNPEDPPAPAEL